MYPADNGLSERIRHVENDVAEVKTDVAVIRNEQRNQADRLDDVRNELRYVKRSLLALVFTVLGGVGVVVAQAAINGGLGQ